MIYNQSTQKQQNNNNKQNKIKYRLQIAFVGQKNAGNWLVVGKNDFVVHILAPLEHRLKRRVPLQVKDNDCCNGVLVVDAGHCAKAFVTRHVPQLQIDCVFVVPLERFDCRASNVGQLNA